MAVTNSAPIAGDKKEAVNYTQAVPRVENYAFTMLCSYTPSIHDA